MKLVNPDFLGFSVDYAFIGIELQCKQFSDPYSNMDYARTGCYACKHLNIQGYRGLECDKKNSVDHVPVRKDEADMLLEICSEYSSSRDRYGRSGCSSCSKKFWGSSRVKCGEGHLVREEILRM